MYVDTHTHLETHNCGVLCHTQSSQGLADGVSLLHGHVTSLSTCLCFFPFFPHGLILKEHPAHQTPFYHLPLNNVTCNENASFWLPLATDLPRGLFCWARSSSSSPTQPHISVAHPGCQVLSPQYHGSPKKSPVILPKWEFH